MQFEILSKEYFKALSCFCSLISVMCCYGIFYLTHCGAVMPYGDTNLVHSGNGSMPVGTKRLPEPILTNSHHSPDCNLMGNLMLFVADIGLKIADFNNNRVSQGQTVKCVIILFTHIVVLFWLLHVIGSATPSTVLTHCGLGDFNEF